MGTRLILVQQHQADVGVREHVAPQAQRREVRRRGDVLVPLLNRDRADGESAGAAGQSRPAQNGDRLTCVGQPDAAAEEQDVVAERVRAPAAPAPAATTTTASTTIAAAAALAPDAELEDAGVLEEEVALLGKQQVEPREVDLLLVGLDLREIGVDREVPRQAAR